MHIACPYMDFVVKFIVNHFGKQRNLNIYL